jgi:hypothetical protein
MADRLPFPQIMQNQAVFPAAICSESTIYFAKGKFCASKTEAHRKI